MGLFSKIFGKKNVVARKGEPDMIYVASEDEAMNWGIEKAKLTLGYFERSLKNPQPHQQYFSVKIHIVDGKSSEHIWLTSPSFDDEGNLFGIVGNEPVNVSTVKIDQKIGVDRKMISDWMIIENGRLIGGYTLRVLRDQVPETEREEFDRSLNMYIDEGVDYFEADLNTPEGAILSLEKAYSTKNLDAALACKDFNEEARLMLAQREMPLDEDTCTQLAEVLEMSFISNLEEQGFPDFSMLLNAFPQREKLDDEHWIITEVCWFPDCGKSIQKLNVFKSDNGWKVLGLADQS